MKFGASECVLIAAVALAVGCSKVEDGDLPTKPGDVLVSVNGDTFTKGDVDELAQLSTDVETLRNKGKKDSQFDPNKYKAEFIRTCLGGFVERTLYKQVAKDLRLTVTEAECDRQLGYLMKIISVAQRGGNPVALRITEDKIKRLKRQVREELLSQKGREASIAAVPKPTEKELKFRRQQIEDYNRIAEQTNALVWARATNVWEQLKGGADFKAMAKKYCEVEGGTEDGAWGEWGLSDLMKDDRELANALTGLSVGDFTVPVEGDNGVVIVKLLSKREVTRRKDVNDKNAPMIKDIQFDLARIYFRLPVIYAMPTEAELQKVLEEMCRTDAWEQKLANLKRSAKIEWPYGTNIAERLVAKLSSDKVRNLPKEVRAKMPKEVQENLSKGVEFR